MWDSAIVRPASSRSFDGRNACPHNARLRVECWERNVERLPPMPEAPIQTVGVIREVLPRGVYRVELPNGKLVVGHLPRRLAVLTAQLALTRRVHLEMTPYDFEKARIAGLADQAHE